LNTFLNPSYGTRRGTVEEWGYVGERPEAFFEEVTEQNLREMPSQCVHEQLVTQLVFQSDCTCERERETE
jgi:hypothetical protein